MHDALPAAASGPITPRARFTATALVVMLFAIGAAMVHANSQWVVFGVLAAFGVLLVLAERTRAGRMLAADGYRQPRLTSLAALFSAMVVMILFREADYTLLMLATVTLFATACIGLNIQMAFAGMANFAGAAFFTAGAYSAAVLTSVYHVPSLLALLFGGVAAVLLGLVLLLPILRTRGHYAALVTIAFGLLVRTFLEVSDLFGGPQGMKVPGLRLFGFAFNDVETIAGHDVSFYLPYALASLVLFALCFVIARRVEMSFIGIALDAVRSDETAAVVFGLSITRWKATAFLVGNAMIGLAGALFGMMNGFVTPGTAGLAESLILLSIVVLGGLGNHWGAVVAAAVVLVVPEKLQFIQEYRLLIFALLVIGILRFRPLGLLPRRMRDLSGLAGARVS